LFFLDKDDKIIDMLRNKEEIQRKFKEEFDLFLTEGKKDKDPILSAGDVAGLHLKTSCEFCKRKYQNIFVHSSVDIYKIHVSYKNKTSDINHLLNIFYDIVNIIEQDKDLQLDIIIDTFEETLKELGCTIFCSYCQDSVRFLEECKKGLK